MERCFATQKGSKKMKFINNLLKRYLEKRGFFVESPSVDQYNHILNRVPQSDFEDHLQLRAVISSDIIDECLDPDNLEDYDTPECVICHKEVNDESESYWYSDTPDDVDSRTYIHAHEPCLFHDNAKLIYDLLLDGKTLSKRHVKAIDSRSYDDEKDKLKPKLYAWQPKGFGPLSFFVMALSEDQAKDSVDRYIRDQLNKDDWMTFGEHSFDGWGTDNYKLTVLDFLHVITHGND
jgi:hypothetical protein